MRMLSVAGEILGSVVRSLFISIVMFVIAFSIITGEFPPDFGKIPKIYESLQQMTALSRQIHEQDKTLRKKFETEGEVEDVDVMALEDLNIKKSRIGCQPFTRWNSASRDR